MVVGIVDNVTIVRWTEQLAGSVKARSDHRQSTGKRLEHNQGAGVVKRRMNQEIGREIAMQHVSARTEELYTIADAQAARQPLIPLRALIACHQEAEAST